jgi:hypothetical protein
MLFKINNVNGTGPVTLTFETPAGTVLTPSVDFAAGNTNVVMKAQSLSFYVATVGNLAETLLMMDPDGMAGPDHTDAQPALDAVEDLQFAVGVDGNGDGILTDAGPDEWLGNVGSGELPGPALGGTGWNNGAGSQQPRQVRATLVAKTTNKYSGVANTAAYENRTSYPAYTAATGSPRLRPLRIVVAPRVWNMTK